MRVLIKNQKIFFDSILNNNGISLKTLSKQINVNYSTLKKWKCGEYLIPLEIFNVLLKYSNEQESWKNRITLFEDTWGQSKGGKTYVDSISRENLKERMVRVRKFRKSYFGDINIKITENFCEFYGALLGDGCLCKFNRGDGYFGYEIGLTGNIKYDYNYHLLYLKPLIKKIFKVDAHVYSNKKEGIIKTRFRNKAIMLALSEFGFPVGKKGVDLIIPKKLINSSWNNQRALIRGLFDTDGCIFAKKGESYKYPHVAISSISYKLLEQLYSILKKQHYPCYISGNDIRIKGIKNIKKWMSDIGTSNLRNEFKYNYWVENGVLPAYILENLGKRF